MALLSDFLKEISFYHMDAPNETIPTGWAICDGRTLTNPNNTDPTTWLQEINPGANQAYTLPDLRNTFLLGADSTKAAGTTVLITDPNINAGAGAPGPKGTGGLHTRQLTTNELPTHTHTATVVQPTFGVTDPGHNHTLTDPGHKHTITDPSHGHSGASNTAADHVHSLTDPGHYHSANSQVGSAVNGPTGGAYTGSGNTGTATTGITANAAGAHSHVITVATSTTGITMATTTAGITMANGTTGITITPTGGSTTLANTGSGNAFDGRPRYYGVVAIMRVRN